MIHFSLHSMRFLVPSAGAPEDFRFSDNSSSPEGRQTGPAIHSIISIESLEQK